MMATSNAFMPHLHQPSHYHSHHQQTQTQQHPSHLNTSLWQSTPRASTSTSTTSYPSHHAEMSTFQQSTPQQQAPALVATGKKRKRLQRACVACHKAKRRCDGGLPCSNCDFSGRTCAYSDSQGKAVPPTKRTLRPSEAAMQEQKVQQQYQQAHSATHDGYGKPIGSSQSPSPTSPSSLQSFAFTGKTSSGFGGERWTSQLDLAWSAIHTFADAASMMMKGAQESEGQNETVQLPLTVAHNLAVILERMNEQHALITEHMTAMGVAMLKTSCSAASEASSSHHDHHAWSDLERRSDRLQMGVRMDSTRLSETQRWLSNGGTVAYRQKDGSSTSQQRASWSNSPPSRSRTSLSPVQASSNGQSSSMLNMPPLKSRHSSTSSSTTTGSSVMTIGQQMGQEQAPFLPPLSGLSNGKSKPHTLPPLRFPSPSNAEESNAIRRSSNESNGSAKWTPLSTLSHGSMYERMRA